MNGPEIARIVGEAIVAGGAIWGIVRYILDRRQRSKEEQNKKLRTHFEDLKAEIMESMISFIGKLKSFGGRLGLDYDTLGSYINLQESFDFEKGDLFLSFELHFPERAIEWRQLKQKAIEHNKVYEKFETQKSIIEILEMAGEVAEANAKESNFDLRTAHDAYEEDKQKLFNQAEGRVKDFREFHAKLTANINNISKYEIGKKFKKHKDCPICKRF
jgi:hypothetical protein